MVYFSLVTEREIRRATGEKNRSNVIGIVREFLNPSIETDLDVKFFGEKLNNSIY